MYPEPTGLFLQDLSYRVGTAVIQKDMMSMTKYESNAVVVGFYGNLKICYQA